MLALRWPQAWQRVARPEALVIPNVAKAVSAELAEATVPSLLAVTTHVLQRRDAPSVLEASAVAQANMAPRHAGAATLRTVAEHVVAEPVVAEPAAGKLEAVIAPPAEVDCHAAAGQRKQIDYRSVAHSHCPARRRSAGGGRRCKKSPTGQVGQRRRACHARRDGRIEGAQHAWRGGGGGLSPIWARRPRARPTHRTSTAADGPGESQLSDTAEEEPHVTRPEPEQSAATPKPGLVQPDVDTMSPAQENAESSAEDGEPSQESGSAGASESDRVAIAPRPEQSPAQCAAGSQPGEKTVHLDGTGDIAGPIRPR